MKNFLLLLCGYSVGAFDPSLPADALSLYPCDENKLDAVLKTYGLFQNCERQAQDPTWCQDRAGVSAGTLCLCLACSDSFAFMISTYEDMIRAGQCPVQLYNVTFGTIPSILMRYPCLFKQLSIQKFASYCPDPKAWMCGVPPVAALFPSAGANTRKTCQAAMQGGCAASALWRIAYPIDPVCPWCQKNNNGVAFINSTGAPVYQPTFASVLDFACDPTSLYASQIVRDTPGYQDTNFTVELFETSDTLKVANPIQLLPKYRTQGYDSPPSRIMTQSDGMYDVISCLPGVFCQQGFVRQCWKGSYCPTVTSSYNCYQGSYCPQGSTAPMRCGFLEKCSGMYITVRTQLFPIAVAVAIVILGIIIHSVARIYECCMARRVQPADHWVALRSPRPTSSQQLTVEFKNVSVEVGEGATKKTILHSASGHFAPGLLTAVMGPSGSSKSTLMDAVLGNIKCTPESSISVNGQQGNLAAFRGMVGFVGQQDVLHRSLTVREAILHSAYLRLPSTFSRVEVEAEVEAVLQELGLTECANTIIGDGERRGVSGGQRKRTSIGVELVANPRVLFMDEPTTGLSSTQSLSLTRSLRHLARGGRTVVAVIHQPRHDMFIEFDSIFLLAKGHICFQGLQNMVVPFFQHVGYTAVSPEELMDVLCGKSTTPPSLSHTPSQLAEQFAEWRNKVDSNALSEQQTPTMSQPAVIIPTKKESRCGSRLPSGSLRQFWAHFTMEFKLRYRNPGSTLTFAFIYLFAGALLGVGFLQSKGIFVPPVPSDIGRLCPPSVRTLCMTEPIDWTSLRLSSFFLSLALGQSALVSAVWTFGKDMDVQFRQAGVGVSQSAYFVAKVVADIPFIIAGSALFAAVFVPMLRPDVEWYMLWVLFALLCWAAYGLGYLLSLVLPRSSAIVVGVVIIFAFSICSGLAPKLRIVHEQFSVLRVFWDISFPRYLVEAFVILEARLFLRPPPYAFSESTRLFFTEYGFKEGNVPFDLFMVFLIGLGLRGLSLLSLRRWHRPKTGST